MILLLALFFLGPMRQAFLAWELMERQVYQAPSFDFGLRLDHA